MKLRYKVLIGLAVVLLAVRIALPFMIKKEANARLSSLPDYDGHLDGVSLALWRGAFALKNVELEHRAGDMAITLPEFGFNINWGALFRRQIVVDVDVASPRIRILAQKPAQAVQKTGEKAAEAKQTIEQKSGKSLPDLLAGLVPFKVSRLNIHDGSLRFRQTGEDIRKEAQKDKQMDKNSEEANQAESGLEVRVTNIDIEVSNLTNIRRTETGAKATGKASAKIMDSTPLKLELGVFPLAQPPKFDLGIDLRDLPLKDLNPVFDWQFDLAAKQGTFTLLAEAAAADGGFKGYIRPLVKDFDVKPKKRGVIQAIKETAVKVVASVLENKDTKAVATQVPFEGRFENPQAGIWEAIIEVLRNAFVEALRPSFDPTFKKKNR